MLTRCGPDQLNGHTQPLRLCRESVEPPDDEAEQGLMPADGEQQRAQDAAGPLTEIRPAGLQLSPSKQQLLWLKNPNSHTSVHLDPALEKQVTLCFARGVDPE